MNQTVKTPEVKVFRDPVHRYIHVDEQVIWDLINTSEFQRLRRIRQLGGVSQVYHTAEHTRFAHSLGVYEIVRRMIAEVESIRVRLSEKERTAVMAAGLLHDLGHGPYSHFYESLSGISHEVMTEMLILSDQTEVGKVLRNSDPGLPELVASVLNGTCENRLLHSMISSQLDADRMDYLLRDAYETGTTYGSFDLERIIRTLRGSDSTIAIKRSGIHAVEDYIMARYQMYYQVYLHPDSHGFEKMIHSFFDRLEELRQSGVPSGFPDWVQIPKADEDTSRLIREFLMSDESVFQTAFHLARNTEDPVLSDLSKRILDRRLPVWMDDPDPETERRIRQKMEEAGFPTRFYFHKTEPGLQEVLPYQEHEDPILVEMDHTGNLSVLSACSDVALSLCSLKKPARNRIYYPREIQEALREEDLLAAAGGQMDECRSVRT